MPGAQILILIVVAIVSVAAGATAPLLMLRGASHREHKDPEKPGPDMAISFGDVTVNLADGRLNRYLRVKIVLVVDGKQATKCEEHLEEKKAALKNWLITHLSDKTLPDITGRVSINRIRREILEHFSGKLFPHGGDHLRDVLFEEFVVQ